MTPEKQPQKAIQVCAHWQGLAEPALMGTLYAALSRGKEIFSFEYDPAWLQGAQAQTLDPNLGLFAGPQYPRGDHSNFGLFLDSAPDRWGRLLMQRRHAQMAAVRKDLHPGPLRESDYLLGVFDGYRMGGLRFRLSPAGPFLDPATDTTCPPWTRLRDLEYASLQLEREGAEKAADYKRWLNLLIAPGASLGGARPKAGVVDEKGRLWIAKFPSRKDDMNVGAWEYLLYQLALKAGIETAASKIQRFSGRRDTFLTRRFDRAENHERIHFASAMTLLGKSDGDGGDSGVSYLDIAAFLIKNGAQAGQDLEQLWRRIVFNICVSNVDDHLRNHGFLLREKGWVLSPAFDMNPSPTGDGLTLNISEDDNAQNLDLAMSVIAFFRIKKARAQKILSDVVKSVQEWPRIAGRMKLPSGECQTMKHAFRKSLLIFGCVWTVLSSAQAASTDTAAEVATSSVSVSTVSVSTEAAAAESVSIKPLHALHVTAWMAGSPKYHRHLDELFHTTVVNAVVIDAKEFEGEVYIPGVKMAESAGAYVPAMPDIASWVADLKKQGIYTVARIVVFKDNIMPRRNKSMAVRNPQGELWFDHHNITWLDPYNQDAWTYNLLIALQASKLGFDEVQFDYIRFPTDGSLSQMRFSQPYSKKSAPKALVSFLQQARRLLAPFGTKISIDVFGLTTSVNTGMGIGQILGPMAEQVDYVCPMIYPSHYAKDEYGLPNPNDQPYKTVYRAIHDALVTLGPQEAQKLRPYLQDFSLKGRGIRYGTKEVRAQMQAAADQGVPNWTLWNARCSYNLAAIQTPVVSASSSTVSK